MTDDQIMMAWLDSGMGTKLDPELAAQLNELDSINNLNNDPNALRRSGLKAARFAFRAGVRYAESQAKGTTP